ncbi:hypothetical protein [Actinokineospora pegani]|uniref:hypothetical protein n=1 Tax=Actinokineospora pegani TaxID=2654637 RepID=UPI0012EA4BF3|nr:hypothetical protein [Actinokineospora pegani]
MRYLDGLFGTSRALGIQMAVSALGGDAQAPLLPIYIRGLRDELSDAWPAT